MLSNPESSVAKGFGMCRQIASVIERGSRIGILRYPDKIKNRKVLSCMLLLA
jgi:hypothetical protein